MRYIIVRNAAKCCLNPLIRGTVLRRSRSHPHARRGVGRLNPLIRGTVLRPVKSGELDCLNPRSTSQSPDSGNGLATIAPPRPVQTFASSLNPLIRGTVLRQLVRGRRHGSRPGGLNPLIRGTVLRPPCAIRSPTRSLPSQSPDSGNGLATKTNQGLGSK